MIALGLAVRNKVPDPVSGVVHDGIVITKYAKSMINGVDPMRIGRILRGEEMPDDVGSPANRE